MHLSVLHHHHWVSVILWHFCRSSEALSFCTFPSSVSLSDLFTKMSVLCTVWSNSHLSFVDKGSGKIGSAWFNAMNHPANTNIVNLFVALSTYISLIFLSLRCDPPSQFYSSALLTLHIDLILIFPAGIFAPFRVKGHRGNQTISRPAIWAHAHTWTQQRPVEWQPNYPV